MMIHRGLGRTTNQVNGIESVADASANPVAIDRDGGINEADWQALGTSDTINFGSPAYVGMASWQFRKFADATGKRWLDRHWKDRITAGFINSASTNGGRHSILHHFMTLAMQHPMLWGYRSDAVQYPGSAL